MANDDNEQWHLPKELQIANPKVAEQAAQMRKELAQRLNSPFARLSAAEFGVFRAQQNIPFLQHSLQKIDEDLKNTRGRYTTSRLLEAREAVTTRLAEAYALIGRMDLAARLHPDEAHRQEYLKQVQKPDLDTI